MANIIAVVWDFDKTLINGYMEAPIFGEYNVNEAEFWEEVNSLPQKYWKEQGVRVNPDTIYLNTILNYVKKGIFKGLCNEKLESYGNSLSFYDGVPDIFKKTKELVSSRSTFQEYNVKVEHYIVSTGLTAIIKGSPVMEYVDGVWGCEFIEAENSEGVLEISEIGYTIDNTTKTRALFEINKGVGRQDGVEVNTALPEDRRRVHFINMVYVADGPSDIPAFSLVNKNGGATFAVYPRGDYKALKQVEAMRKAGRVNMFAEADYSAKSTAYMWLCDKIEGFAERICEEEKEKIREYTSLGVPKHLIQ